MEQESIIISILSDVKFNILVYLMGCYIYPMYSILNLSLNGILVSFAGRNPHVMLSVHAALLGVMSNVTDGLG